MLQAILNGKIGKLFSDLEAQTHWRELYRSNEDFLTASVFARLSYLPSSVFWQILYGAVISEKKLPNHVGELKNIQFWPRWNLTKRKQKEPDIFIEFEKVNLIIEAKLPFNPQYAEQWAEEFWAYQCDAAEEYEGKDVYLLAIDGLSDNFEQLETEANQILTKKYNFSDGICAVACSWQSLLSAIINQFQSVDDSKTVSQFLIHDLKESLALHGIHDTHWLKDIGQENTLSKVGKLQDSSIRVFNTLIHGETIPMNDINAALIDVRKAYRLLYLYQKSVLDLAKEIADGLDFQQNCCWTPIQFKTPPNRDNSPFKDRWAWDMLPMYDVSFLFLREGVNKEKSVKVGECLLKVHIISDNGYQEKGKKEPNPIEFQATENSDTILELIVIQASKDLGKTWVNIWNNNSTCNFDTEQLLRKYEMLLIRKEYCLAELSDQESLNRVLEDFKANLCERGIELFPQ